jgi:ribonuclease J
LAGKAAVTPHKLRIIPLGGLGEVGKNMMLLEHGDDIIAIDAGLMFPGETLPGVDLLIPDIGYLAKRERNLRGIVITHGHEDHIGALPYLIPRLPSVPVFATKFTQELIRVELKQRGVKAETKLNLVSPGSTITLGSFSIEFFSVCHSIPDSVGLIIHTPQGIVVHSGDFKLDHTPVLGEFTNFTRLASLGTKGVLLLLSDSTYVELPGYTPSERVVTDTLDRVIGEAKGRVIITTFASLISRIQQVFDVASKHGRRVFVIGRSMKEIVNMALKRGYLNAPPGLFCHWDELKALPSHRIVILTTGSQGEPTSALVRMANRDPSSRIQIIPGDTVVISATPIPGNEGVVNKTADSLFRQGANVIYDKLAQVHVHGHGSKEELKLLLNLVKPKFFVPIHGEYRHLSLHAQLAQSVGIARENIFVLEDGDVLELEHDGGRVVEKIPVQHIYVSGFSVGELDEAVLRERRMLSRDGVAVVSIAIDPSSGKLLEEPRIVMKGFIDSERSESLIQKARDVVRVALDQSSIRGRKRRYKAEQVKTSVEASLAAFFWEETRRRPVVIPVIMELGKR